MNLRVSLLAAALVLAGCGGGGGGSSQPVPATGGSSNTQVAKSQGTVVLSIPTGSSSSGKVRYPQFVSPSASSVTLVINGGTAQTFDVSATSTLCTTVAGARNCTITFSAPIGADTLTFTIYAGANATGSILSTGTNTQTVALGTPFNVVIAMNATIGTVTANLNTGIQNMCPNAAGINGIIEGCPGSATLTLTVLDPSGATVTGTAPYATPLQISASDPSLTASPASITAPGQSSTLSYSGAAFAAAVTNSITVTLTVGTATVPTPVTVKRQYLYVANSNVVPGNTPAGGGTITVYQFGADGAAVPVRTISTGVVLISDPIGLQLDSNDNLYVLDNGRYVGGQSHPGILVFAPGANGGPAPIRQISSMNNPAVVTNPYTCETMLLNPAQTYLYVMCDDSGIGSGLIHVFPASGNGAAAGLQTAELGSDGWTQPLIGMAFDATGNLYIAGTQQDTIGYYPPANIGSPNGGMQLNGGPAAMSSLNGITSWPRPVSPVGLYIDLQGTLYATLAYFNPVASPPSDVSNELAMWKTTSIPCNSCLPNVTLTGTPFTTHAPAGLTVDAAGNVYVSNPFTNTVNVFSRASLTAGGANVAPLHTITVGSAPVGMVVGP